MAPAGGMDKPMVQPVIILVRPQLVENIGAVARAMMNCALTELRLVAPRDGWPMIESAPPPAYIPPPMADWIAERLFAASSGADDVLRQAQIFPDLAAATADLNHIYATSARDHHMIKPWATPRDAMPQILARHADDQRTGILFGPERTGLTHDDMIFANEVLCIPANPGFTSFNLAQAVLIVAYEWYQAQSDTGLKPRPPQSRPATKGELNGLCDRLERELDAAGFFTTAEMRPTMTRNIRHALQRAEMTDQEVRTWHGIVTALAEGQKRRKAP